MARRATVIKQVRDQRGEALLVGAGDFADRPTESGRIKSRKAIEAMVTMGYDAATIGERELALGEEFLTRAFEAGPPLVVANVLHKGKRFGRESLVVQKKGMTIGLTGVTMQVQDKNLADWTITDPLEALGKVLPGLERKAEMLVVLCHLGITPAIEIAEKFPAVDVIVVGHGARSTPQPTIVGQTLLVKTGVQGKYLGRLDYAWDRAVKKISAYEGTQIGLDEKVPEDPELAALYRSYQEAVKALAPAPSSKSGEAGNGATTGETAYKGAVWCRSCHPTEYTAWVKTPHGRAFTSLKTKEEEGNMQCLPCHTTGFGAGGFFSVDDTPIYLNVQCEACHGPGALHVAQKGRGPLAPVTESVCLTCHTREMDPKFIFELARGQVH